MAGEISHAMEDYAKAIYSLERASEGSVNTTAIADALGVTPASATAMVKRLDDAGLVDHAPYRGVLLTRKGMKVALEVLRHHRLLERYLFEELGLPWDRVHAEAEVLEHVLTEELEELIARKLGDPTVDPHGAPIPDRNLRLVEPEHPPFDALEKGARGRFIRISDRDPEMLRHIGDREIRLGARFEVIERQPFGGPLTVRFEGVDRPQVLGGGLAQAMRACLDDEPS